MKTRFAVAFSALVPLLSASQAAAHGGGGLTDDTAWSAWNLTPEVSGLVALTLAIYLRGAIRRRPGATPRQGWRHLLFGTGILTLFLALQSPVDAMGERLFVAHQIQHLLLRMVGPMLIVLAYPEAVLIAGLPRQVRKRVIAPLLASRAHIALRSDSSRSRSPVSSPLHDTKAIRRSPRRSPATG